MVDDPLDDLSEPPADQPALDFPVPFSGRVGKYQSQSPQQFGMPHRFGIGSILVVMAAISVLLASLMAWGTPAVIILHLVAFVTLIGIAQSTLYQGTNPRRASVLTGLVICPVYVIGLCVYLISTQEMGTIEQAGLLCTMLSSFAFGPLFGYLAGGIVGGIFLIMDVWEKNFGRRDDTIKSYDPFAPDLRDAEELSDEEKI